MSSTSGPSLENQGDRFRWLSFQLIGQQVKIRVKDGRCFDGLLHEATATESGVQVSLCHVKPSTGSILTPHLDRVNFKTDDIAEISATQVNWFFDKSSLQRHRERRGFNTDTGISGTPQAPGQERELVAWQDDSFDGDEDLESLSTSKDRAKKNSSASASSSSSSQNKNKNSNDFLESSLGDQSVGEWDQFKTAQELWGFKSTYDEEFYTTKLDKASPIYKEKMAEAERIAAEITAQQTSNPHVAEERGQETDLLKNMDDADRYSDVIRDDDDPHSTSLLEKIPTTSTTAASANNATNDANSKDSQKDEKQTTTASQSKLSMKSGLRADADDFIPFDIYTPPIVSPIVPAPMISGTFIPPPYIPPTANQYPIPVTSMYYQPPAPYYGTPPPSSGYVVPHHGMSPQAVYTPPSFVPPRQ